MHRTNFEIIASLMPAPADYVVSRSDINGCPGEWVYDENAQSDRVILYLHGGGYCFGSPKSYRSLAARISRASGARILLPDYRLAPEHRCPSALQDALTAYNFLLESGHLPCNIIIGGDSAGGGLAVAAAVALRDGKQMLPAALICISPWTDLSCSGKSISAKKGKDPFVTEKFLRWCGDNYTDSMDCRSPSASPLFANLAGLPPMMIQVGEDELLLDDAVELARNARQAGVTVSLEIWERMWHVWHIFAELIPEADQAIMALGRFAAEKFKNDKNANL